MDYKRGDGTFAPHSMSFKPSAQGLTRVHAATAFRGPVHQIAPHKPNIIVCTREQYLQAGIATAWVAIQ